MAPELLDGAANLRESETSLKQIDIYALGLVIWEMATRCTCLYNGKVITMLSFSRLINSYLTKIIDWENFFKS